LKVQVKIIYLWIDTENPKKINKINKKFENDLKNSEKESK
jgi:hypothetical protein